MEQGSNRERMTPSGQLAGGTSGRTAPSLSRRSLAMAAACAPAGLVVGAFADSLASPGPAQTMWIYGAAAAFATGYVVWRSMVAARPGLFRGAVAGAAVGVAAPAVCSVFISAVEGVQGILAGMPAGPGLLFKSLAIAAGMGAFSLFYAGWATVPAGALLGAVLGALQRRSSRLAPGPTPGARP
ncbi:hypothetical protein G3N56_14715 [Desulfovibrio sulfodismutans]|uniref:Uncharacterized protein n=1 Tax=Desulfolutivibrio sulfodismutans TaxID=63561 RepID=A0A7K3NQD0_9BACT|nr:hypothetical protein [Desulfolutivibrio sulfodismutans]NDY57985.1 hypothetical protein [Desulfolutivibrio sulfodismutans]QLA12759.1 hypothetical protein GD606_10975 [Desulfolutivibrio sulfodismutans DSM 3696]